METSRRVVKETATSDEKQMSEILSLTTCLFNLLNRTNSVSDTIELLKQEYKIVDLISTDIIEEDIKYLKKNAEKVTKKANLLYDIEVRVGTIALWTAETMLQIENHNESKVLRYFKACDATNDTIVTVNDCTEKSNHENEGAICSDTMTTGYEKSTINIVNCSAFF